MNKVTIMIPTYNQSQYIEQCIESVLLQDYPNLEIVVSDDSTNEETEKIIKERYFGDSRVNYFHNTPTLGRVRNYHKTLYERASGDYVLNLDGDDWLIDNTYISQATDILDNHEDVVCVTARKVNYYENENKYVHEEAYNLTLKPIMTGKEYLWEYAINKVSFSHMTTLYRREKALLLGFYNKNIILTDGESMFRLICNNKIAFIPKEVGVWRVHTHNATHQQLRISDFKDLFSIEDNVVQYCKLNNSHIKTLSLKEWATLMKLKRIYPFFYSYISNIDFKNTIILLYKIYCYDRNLFLSLISGFFHKGYLQIKRKLVND